MVERYRMTGYDFGTEPYSDGAWVTYHAYAALERQIAELRAALSVAPATADGWKLVPVEPTRDHLERLATLWGYTLEETADNYGAFLDALPAAPTATEGRCK